MAVWLGVALLAGPAAGAKIERQTDEEGVLHITNVSPENQAETPKTPAARPPAGSHLRGRRGKLPAPPPESPPEAPPEPAPEPEVTPEVTPPPEPPPAAEGEQESRRQRPGEPRSLASSGPRPVPGGPSALT